MIKDVNFPSHLLPHLCQVLQPHLIAMIRNPYANIAYYLQGLERGIFKSDLTQDIKRFKILLDTPEGKHLAHYSPELENMSVAQFEALRWRFQAETLVNYTKNYETSKIVVYEYLCLEPLGKIQEIFDFLGWEFSQTTEDFINASTSNNSSSSKSYYSIYRDPLKSMSKWKKQLTESQKLDIDSITKESPLRDFWEAVF